MTYTGALIRLVADFSTQTLQTRREWKEIFQVEKTRNLQPRMLQTQQSSQLKWKENREFSRQKMAKRIHLHQTSSARDAKGTALRREIERVRDGET